MLCITKSFAIAFMFYSIILFFSVITPEILCTQQPPCVSAHYLWEYTIIFYIFFFSELKVYIVNAK